MNAFETTNRFLVKFRDPSAAASPGISVRLGASGPAVAFASEPLFRSIGVARAPGLAASGGVWRVATASARLDDAQAWDHCHDILAADSSVVAVEPDLVQRWPVSPNDPGQKFGARAGGPHPQDIGGGYSGVADDNYWFRDSAHNQMDFAFAQTSGGAGVRIAHLDTGYDPTHKSVPKHLRADLARNFVDADKPNDATDRSEGAFNNFSHGCGTLSILAGATVPGLKPFGCAPNAEIVPVRVANRVVLFSNSTIAQGFDYVHEPLQVGRDARPCREHEHGRPSVPGMGGRDQRALRRRRRGRNRGRKQLWQHADACRRVSGAIWPGHRRLRRDGGRQPLRNLPLKRMAGNYGPDAKMRTAIAGYTPNVPWARFGEPTVVDFDGNGTSSATPQVAAAAALWIDKHRARLRRLSGRLDARRGGAKALFDSAAKGDASSAPRTRRRHAPRRRRARAWRGAGFATGCDTP